MSVIVKATFSFVADGIMPVIAPDEIHAAEVHYGGNPAESVWAASDLAPYRLRADVVLTGHAPVPDESATVRLAVYRDRALVDKSLDVVPSGDLEGKDRVPLRYEHAPGGPEWEDNPVGTSLPSIVDSSDPQRPVGFGPIAAAWPARARLRGDLDPWALHAPIAALPDDLDWGYFSSVPADQGMEFLLGDEWIVLENLVAEHPVVRMKLPSAHAEARVSGLGSGPGPAVALVADHLHIDVDRARCSVTWRGSFEVPSEDALAQIVVLAGVAVAGQLIAWPAFPPARRASIVVPPPPPPRAPMAAVRPPSTPRPPPPAAPVSRPSLPRLDPLPASVPSSRLAPPPSSRLAPPQPPPSNRLAPPAPPSSRLAPQPPPSSRLPAPRFDLPPLPPPPPSRPALPRLDLDLDHAPARSSFEATMEIEDEPTYAPTLPFAVSVTAPLHVPSPPQPRAPAPSDPFESTMTIGDEEEAPQRAPSRDLPFAAPPLTRSTGPAAPLSEASYALDKAPVVDDDDDDEPEETTVPMAPAFRRARPGGTARPSQGIPGAPWSGVPAAPVPRPEADERTRSLHLDQLLPQRARAPKRDPPPSAIPAAAPPAEAAPPSASPAAEAPPAEAPKSEPKAPSWSWSTVAEAPKVEMKPPPPPRKPPTPAVQNALYSRFTAKKK